MKEIPLTQGKVALVDDDDFDRVASMRWYAWRATWHSKKGAVSEWWYALRKTPGGGVMGMHQMILGVKGVDHVNGNGLDNRRSNLRAATTSQNAMNRRPQGRHLKGVTRLPSGRWQAGIKHEGRSLHLGMFATEVEAAAAYDAAARRLFGEFARTNDVEIKEKVMIDVEKEALPTVKPRAITKKVVLRVTVDLAKWNAEYGDEDDPKTAWDSATWMIEDAARMGVKHIDHAVMIERVQ
jgi:HNH endonuclease/AP2 domain